MAWRSALGNVCFALEGTRMRSSERHDRAMRALERVGLAQHADHLPWQLSGGQQQRLQIARALAYEPHVMLMDEPFGSLDAQTRTDLEDQLLKIWEESQSSSKSILIVTHDIDESIYLSHRVIVLSKPPTRVIEDIVIDLPWPRDQIVTKAHPNFNIYRKTIYRLLGHEG